MIVKRSCGGRGVGGLLIKHAIDCAIKRDKTFLRLDAWTTNKDLHRYYLSQGFELVRIMDVPNRKSGALFELDISAPIRPNG